jgi:hypothetical protein
MEPTLLTEIVTELIQLFNHSLIGAEEWNILEFIENATPCPDMNPIPIPYTVEDANGSIPEEQATHLAALIRDFVKNNSGGNPINQYDRCVYSYGFLDVEYPQAYANAAKYAAWTSWFGTHLDRLSPLGDCLLTGLWVRLNFLTRFLFEPGCVVFSDLLYLRHAGSTLDQALVAYGTLRNMKKTTEFWQPEDLSVIVTSDNKGYLAANLSGEWKYLNFDRGPMFLQLPPEILFQFNENDAIGG